MTSLRIEFIRIVPDGNAVGPSNVIHSVLASSTVTTGGSAASSDPAPAKTTAVRLTAIGGVALVNPTTTVSNTAGIRLADGQTEVMGILPGKPVSYMDGV